MDMKIVTIHSNSITCSLCRKTIAAEEEALQFWNRRQKGSNFWTVHHRHLICQYNKKDRKQSFEEWIKKLKEQLLRSKLKKQIKSKPTWIKYRAPYRGYEFIGTRV